MRILKLDLRAFGPFENNALRFDGASGALQVVYGPNEAGKSSALRALRYALYGIPGQCSDTFRFDNSKLRIGAVLESAEGEQIEFLRRKGNKNTLSTFDGAPLADSMLDRMLAGVDGEAFVRQFGIDHAALVAGGNEALAGKGALGSLLFSASSGIASLRRVQKELDDAASELFTRTGRKQTLHKLINDFRDKQKLVKEKSLRGADWIEHSDAVETLERRRLEIATALVERDSRRRKLERFRAALPRVTARASLIEQLAPLQSSPVLRESFVDDRVRASEQCSTAARALEAAEENVNSLEAQLGALPPRAAILDISDEIEQLQQDLGSHNKAMRDRPDRVAEMNQHRAAAAALLRDVGYTASDAEQTAPRLTRQEKIAIRNLAQRHESLEQQAETAVRTIQIIRERSVQLEEEWNALPSPSDAAPLEAARRRGEHWTQGKAEAAAFEDQWNANRARLEIELKRLDLWSGALETLEALAAPSRETVDHFDGLMREHSAESQALRKRLSQEESERSELETKIAQLESEQDIPTEADVLAARAERNAKWEELRAAILASKRKADAEQNLTAMTAAYEALVARADDLADRLRREARSAAEKSNLLAQREKVTARLTSLREQVDAAAERRNECEREWSSLWRALGVQPRSPAEMRAWLDRRQGLLVLAERVRMDAPRVSRWNEETAALERDLRSVLSISEAAVRACDVQALVDRARNTFAGLEAVETRRASLASERAEKQRQLAQAESDADRARTELAKWEGDWRSAVSRLKLEPAPEPAAANLVLDGLSDAFENLDKVETIDERIRGIDADAKRFAETVSRVAAQASVSLESTPAATALALKTAVASAQKVESERTRLSQQRDREDANRKSAREQQQAAEAKLAALCREACCKSADDLPAAEEASRRRLQLESELRATEERLREHAQETPLAEFIARAESLNVAELDAELAQVSIEVDSLGEAKDRIATQIGETRARLEAMDCGAESAEAEAEAQGILAELNLQVEEYARLKLAGAVLREAVERHRKKNQDPVLGRAGEIFSRLTLESFKSLSVSLGERDEPVILGVRPNDDMVNIDGMSEGTVDQLYLALRLASLEHYLERHEPMPFIVDDILITFDDARALAALQILSELAQRTQVILFTHHARIVQLVEANFESAAYSVQELGAAGPAVLSSRT